MEISANQTDTKPWLLTLDEIEGTDLPIVGGKAFRLAMLKQHGINVPQGLALTTLFFETHIKTASLTPLWAGSPDVAVTTDSLNWLADSLKTKPLPKKLSQALNKQIATLFDSDVNSFAVRSSAIDEDQSDHAFAGIHLTELAVPRSMIPIAITRCWASALSGTALDYRLVNGMSIQGIRIAILIQPMLKPTSSGVSFTINPLTGSRDELIVEATWGPGQALVSGEIQPHFYKLANQPPDYPILEQHKGNIPPPGTETDDSPISTTELIELVTYLEQIKALMGEAQDVEWARQDDSFFILQTRPVTALPEPTQTLDWEWTRGSYRESLPELPSPLLISLLEYINDRKTSFFKEELGLQVDELGAYTKIILGRPYFNLTFIKRVITQAGIAPGGLLYTLGHTESNKSGSLSIDWETAWQARAIYWRVLKRILNNSRYLKQFKALVDKMVTNFDKTKPEEDTKILLAQLRQHSQIYNELFKTDFGLNTAFSTLLVIGSTVIASTTQSPAAFIIALAMKGVKTVDSRLNHALSELGRLAYDNKQMREYLADAPADFHDYSENQHIPPEFKHDFDKLLMKYGQRATYEMDIGYPRYEEEPALLLRIIRQHAQSQQREIAEQSKTIDHPISWQRLVVAPCIRLIRHYIRKLDELHTARAKIISALHYWNLNLGKNWFELNWLNQPEDIFWLTMEEIERTLIIDSEAGITLSSTVQARKETYKTYKETAMPASLYESQIASIQLGFGLSLDPISDTLIGLPISPGQARGTVIVLTDPDDFKQSDKDDLIVVMPSTDPAWLPLLHLAAGLIVETGGLLSHGSVIAREYGLPAVANIPDATRRFQNGDTVLVDGSTGIVQLLEPASESI